MNAATSHPLAAAYLRDLELLLHGLDPGERAEVLIGVREHLTAAAGPDATSDQVRAALAELGSPQSIADEAYADLPQRRATAPGASRWQAVVACVLNGLGLAFLAMLTATAIGPAWILGLAPMFALPWGVVVALSLLCPVWNSSQKAASILLGPGTLSCVALLVAILLTLNGPVLFNAIPILAIFIISVWILARLLRQTLRQQAID